MIEKVGLIRVLAFACLFFCGSSSARATEYYISPTGNDAGSGTLFSPWQSPSRGAGMRANGAQAIGSTVINVRDNEGYLASGNLSVGGNTVAYTSKTDTQFILASPLAVAVGNDAVINDADILGGVGFQPSDTIYFRGGTWTNQRLRLKASGTSVGGHITYAALPGETPLLRIVNMDGGQAAIWNDGESAATKTEFVILDGLSVFADQNLPGMSGDCVGFSSVNASIIRNVDLTSTGGAVPQGSAIKAVKTSSLEIENSILWTKFEAGLRVYYGGSTVSIHHTVIGGVKYGILSQADTVVTADHLTMIDIPNLALQLTGTGWEGTTAPARSTLTNSIVYYNDSSGVLQTLNVGSGDYNNIYNSADPYSNLVGDTTFNWNASTTFGTDGVPGANDYYTDPGFLLSEFVLNEPNRFDPTWLRFLASSPAATASDTGSWIGAFAPIVAGDVNGDGFVGGTDLTIIGNNWGMVDADRDDGDLSGDGTVSGLDWTEVVTNWGGGELPTEPAGIPEPATLALLLVAAAVLPRKKRGSA